MEAYISTIFEDIRHERYFVLLLSFTDLDILKQRKFFDHEINTKNLAPEKLHRQGKLIKEYFAVSLIE